MLSFASLQTNCAAQPFAAEAQDEVHQEHSHEVVEHHHDEQHTHEHQHGPGEAPHSHEHSHNTQAHSDLKFPPTGNSFADVHLKSENIFVKSTNGIALQGYLKGIFRPPIV